MTQPIAVGAAGNLYPPVSKLIANAQRAEERGYDSVFWPDHLMAWHPESMWTDDVTPMASLISTPHVHVDVVAAMTAAALGTENVRVGTAVTEAIRRNPAVLAQEMLTVHHFSSGRSILGIGAGEGENIIPYGLDFSKPAGRLEEALKVIRLLWESEGPVSFAGEHFTLNNAVMGLGAYEGTFPEIWIAAHGPRMCRITGELGDGWMPTSMPAEQYSDRLELIRKAATEAGRDPEAITPSLFVYVVPAEEHEIAHELLRNPIIRAFCLAADDSAFRTAGTTHPLGSGIHGLLDYIPAGLSRQEAENLINAIPDKVVHDYIWHGNVDELEARAREFANAGLRHFLPWNVAFFGDISRISESFAILDKLCHRLSQGDQ